MIVKMSHKGMNLEERYVAIQEWKSHPAWELFTQHYKENYPGNDPETVALADIFWLNDKEDWNEAGDEHPAKQLIHPRYGRVMGHTTFTPFPDYLHHEAPALAKKGIEVILDFGNGVITWNINRETAPNIIKFRPKCH